MSMVMLYRLLRGIIVVALISLKLIGPLLFYFLAMCHCQVSKDIAIYVIICLVIEKRNTRTKINESLEQGQIYAIRRYGKEKLMMNHKKLIFPF